jgi:hypothetical protein
MATLRQETLSYAMVSAVVDLSDQAEPPRPIQGPNLIQSLNTLYLDELFI